MIKIDGHEIKKNIKDFKNLEDLLTALKNEERMKERVITEVLINGESFSEIYPHQAEDMECDGVETVEIKSIPQEKMAVDMAGELEKVALMMGKGSRSVSELLRESKNTDALELLQDLLDVTRDFMGLLNHIRDAYLGGASAEFAASFDNFSNLVSEMSETLENEDWTLLADLLEFEYAPACDEWRKVGAALHKELKAAQN